jgi:hypothetical protein
VLLWLFSQIGTTNRRFVEFGVEDGRECNTANLSLSWGWQGLLLEPDPAGAESARRFYLAELGNNASAVTVREAFVTPENINEILADEGFDHEFDLLSIDIDSHDYWVWKAIEKPTARVVVIEYNATLGPDRSATIPYDPSFRYDQYFHGGVYHGASLAALTKIANGKGYALIGCESQGANAFFVRRDCLAGTQLVECTAKQAWRPLRWRDQLGDIRAQQRLLVGLALQEV